jgi:hypothetical protein
MLESMLSEYRKEGVGVFAFNDAGLYAVPNGSIRESNQRDFWKKWFTACAGSLRADQFFQKGDDKSLMIYWSRAAKPKAFDGLRLNRTWVEEFTERPYFKRPKLLPSGKATPETSQNRIGKARFQTARQGHSENEDSSYLLVSADVPQEAPTLPERRSHWSAERGHHFITPEGVPIEGAMTLQELVDEVNREFVAKIQMPCYMEVRQMLLNEADRRARVEMLCVKKEWTPYWEGMLIHPADQVKTTVHYKEVIDINDLFAQGRAL